MLYLQKYLMNFQKHFLAEDEEGGYCRWKFQVHRYFGFAIATLQIFQHPENVKISIFPLHCPSRNAITSKVFNEFSKKFFLDERWGRWLLWLKISSAQSFWFCKIATWPLFQHPGKWKISIFPVHCPAEMLYLQKYLTNFKKLFFAGRGGRLLLCLKISSAKIFWFAVATFQLFQHPEYVKI